MRKALFFILLLVVFLSALIIDRNVRQESKTARYGTTAPDVRDDDILEITIGHPEGLPAGREERTAPGSVSGERTPRSTQPSRPPSGRTEPPAPREGTAAPAAQDPRGERRIYVVVEGDTLSGIAKKLLGDESKVNLLIEWNELRNPDQIYPGDRLRYYTR